MSQLVPACLISTCYQTQRQLPCKRAPTSNLSSTRLRVNVAAAAGSSSAGSAAAPQAAAKQTLTVYFREEDVSTTAAAGDDLVEVAKSCGVTIPTGCWQGNCGVCEVEVYKYTGDADKDKGAATSPAVVRACITKLPPGYSRVEVAQMEDAIWGLDGFDT